MDGEYTVDTLPNNPDLSPQTQIILNSIADGVFTVDLNWRITFFNKAAEEITGIGAAEAVGKPCCEVFRANVCETTCVLKHTMETLKPVVNKPIAILHAKWSRAPRQHQHGPAQG